MGSFITVAAFTAWLVAYLGVAHVASTIFSRGGHSTTKAPRRA